MGLNWGLTKMIKPNRARDHFHLVYKVGRFHLRKVFKLNRVNKSLIGLWLVRAWKPSLVDEHFSGNQNEYFSIWNKTICFISSSFGLKWFLEVWGVESWIISSHSLLSWDWVNPSDDILSYLGIHLHFGLFTGWVRGSQTLTQQQTGWYTDGYPNSFRY